MVSNPGPTEPAASQPKRRGPPPALTSESMRAELEAQAILIITHVDERINGIQAKVSALEQRVPDPQAIVDRVAAVLGPELSKQINDKLEVRAAIATEIASNGHRAVSETPDAAPGVQPKLSERLTDWTAIAGAIADVLLSKYSVFKQDMRLDRAEARADKLYEVNPFAVADAMRASNNPMLPLYTAAFAPTPQAVAEARLREATDATVIGLRAGVGANRMLKEEQTRQRETPSPGSPNSSGSPTGTSTPLPTNPSEPKPGGVNMNSNPTSKPRLTLREVMG